VLDASPRGVLITCRSFVPTLGHPFPAFLSLGGECSRGLWKGDATLSTVDMASPESICRQAEGERAQPGLCDSRIVAATIAPTDLGTAMLDRHRSND